MEYGPDARIVPKLSAFEGSRKPANKNSHAVPMQQIKNRKVLNFRLPILIYFNNLERRKKEKWYQRQNCKFYPFMIFLNLVNWDLPLVRSFSTADKVPMILRLLRPGFQMLRGMLLIAKIRHPPVLYPCLCNSGASPE